MNQQQQVDTMTTPSQLDRFNIGFEYDKTLQQVKRDMRIRTMD